MHMCICIWHHKPYLNMPILAQFYENYYCKNTKHSYVHVDSYGVSTTSRGLS